MIEVPPVVRNKALACGANRWLAQLPALVADIESDWSITVGHSFDDATEGFVAAARLDDGTPAVLKLVIPRDGDAAAHEATVLRLCDGVGCVCLIRDDLTRGALLLERLGPSLADLRRPITERHRILAGVARQVWRPAANCGLPTGAEKATGLIELILTLWEELDRPCAERTVAHAVSCADRRRAAFDAERAVLVHGDVHQWNALACDDGFKLVDPDGLLAQPEYDMGIVMREDPLELLDGDAFGRAEWLAACCHFDLDPTAIWEWGVVERVSTGLLGTQVGLQPVARQMLLVADRLSG